MVEVFGIGLIGVKRMAGCGYSGEDSFSLSRDKKKKTIITYFRPFLNP